jgi:hypothetical protein
MLPTGHVLSPVAGQSAADGIVGAFLSRVLCHTRRAEHEAVLELGAGTGVISRALLASGMPANRFIMVEIVRQGASPEPDLYAEHRSSRATRAPPDLLPPHFHGRIGTSYAVSRWCCWGRRSSAGSSARSRRWRLVLASCTTGIAPPRRCPPAAIGWSPVAKHGRR